MVPFRHLIFGGYWSVGTGVTECFPFLLAVQVPGVPNTRGEWDHAGSSLNLVHWAHILFKNYSILRIF